MRNLIFIFFISFALLAFGLDKPTNYVATLASGGGTRTVQQRAASFAAWNFTSGNWKQVIPPNVGGGSIAGIVAVGDGLLAYGSFTTLGSGTAAGLAYYDGNIWAAPEGVGLYTLAINSSYSYYDNIPDGTGSAYAAVTNGNTVYLLGTFDQVGNVRDGVAGFVALTWSAGGVFSISKIGQGYYKPIATVPASPTCTTCAQTSQPGAGNRNKLKYYTVGGNQYFVFQPSTIVGSAPSANANLFQWQVNTGQWYSITASNQAINITNNVADFDIVADATPSIYVVGKFQRLNDPVATFRYMHIAVSNDQGASFVNVPPTLDTRNFGEVQAVLNQTTGVPISPATSNSVGFYAIAVQSRSSIYVAGGYRVSTGFVPSVAYSNEVQTVILQLQSSGISYTSSRFGSSTAFTTANTVNGPTITQLNIIGSNLYIFGGFTYYNQIIPEGNPVNRFNIRYTDVYKGAAVLNLNSLQVTPAFGGFITSSDTDTSPTLNSASVFSSVSPAGDILYFASAAAEISATYGLLSGGIFAYGGDASNNQTNKWNAVLGNRRFVSGIATQTPSGAPFPYFSLPAGADGQVYALHITLSQDVVIFGGQFDFIGTARVPGIGFYNPDTGTFGTVGGGLFQYDNKVTFAADGTYYNRLGGRVFDISERDGYLYAAGLFNRNNSGNPLYNIARISFRSSGAGWLQIDGGCDGQINDILINGDILYVTGDIRFCGLNPESYSTGGLNRGRVPHSSIAAIDLSLDPSQQSWRNLGIGLQGGVGKALAWYKGQLYVGGGFTSAGGVLFSNGIARWDGNKWSDVVGDCLLPCDRPTNTFPLYTAEINNPATTNQRRPAACQALSSLNGNLYCITTTTLNWWDGSVWHQTSNTVTTINPGNTFQNNLIVNNGSTSKYILVSGAGASQKSPGDLNYYNFNTDTLNYEPAFTGFSTRVNSIVSSANTN